MTITVGGTTITFNDTTTQATAARSGGTTTSSAVDITLTVSSNQFQQVTMTAASKYVILPDATTMTKGANVFVIENKGAYPFGIKDSTGNIVQDVVYFFQEVTVTLRDNSTAAGTWGFGTTTAVFASQGPLNLSSLSYSQATMAVAPLSSTAVLIVYQSAATPTYSAVVATISGTTVTYGTAVTVISSASYFSGNVRVLALSSTSAAVFVTTTGGVTNGIAASISGTTITVGTATSAGTGSYQNFIAQSSTVGVSVYSTTGTTVFARAFSLSGTTFTWGTAVSLYTVAGSISGIGFGLSSTNNYVVVATDTTPRNQHRAFSISGTTITAGATTTIDSTNTDTISGTIGYNISSGSTIFTYGAAATSYYTLVYSGTTFSSVSTGTNNTSGLTFGFTASSGTFRGKQGWGTSVNLYNGGAYVDLSTGTPSVSYILPTSNIIVDYAVLDTTNVLAVTSSSTSVVAARVVKFTG
jgi:hypothetical protein